MNRQAALVSIYQFTLLQAALPTTVPFIPDHFNPPRTVALSGFSLAVLSPPHAEQDFAAVCASADVIRHVFGLDNGWPPPTISHEENTADLIRHEAEFNDRYAFAYAVLCPNERSYLGCLYLKPIKSKHGRDRRYDLFAAQAFLWMSVLHQHPAGAFVQAEVDRWFTTHWPINAVAWPGRVQSWSVWNALAATPSAA